MTPAEGIEYLQGLPQNEPVFVLRAQDAYAPATVGVWAAMCAQRYNDPKQDAATEPTRAKGQRAFDLVREMREWQAVHGSKTPD